MGAKKVQYTIKFFLTDTLGHEVLAASGEDQGPVPLIRATRTPEVRKHHLT